MARCRLCCGLERFDVIHDPFHEQPCVDQAVKDKGWRADHALVQQRGADAAGFCRRIGAPPVGRDQGRLCRGQRDVVIAVGVQAVDAQRADDADGDFHSADEVFNIGVE